MFKLTSSTFLTTFGMQQSLSRLKNKKSMLWKILGFKHSLQHKSVPSLCVCFLWFEFEQRISSQANLTQKVSEDQLGNKLPYSQRISRLQGNQLIQQVSSEYLLIFESPEALCNYTELPNTVNQDTGAWVNSPYTAMPGIAQTQTGHGFFSSFIFDFEMSYYIVEPTSQFCQVENNHGVYI